MVYIVSLGNDENEFKLILWVSCSITALYSISKFELKYQIYNLQKLYFI